MAINTGSAPKATMPGGLSTMFGKVSKPKKTPTKKKKC